MAFGVIGSVIEAMMFGPEGMDYAAMSIAGVDSVYPGTILLPERSFQYWPESISDTIDVGWNFKDIPGASHALAQWSGNAGRTITFEIQLHRFMKPVASRSVFEKILDPIELNTPSSEYLRDNRPYNVDVAAEVKYLRAFCYPSFKDLEGYRTSYPPVIGMLSVPGHRLSDTDEGDVIYVIMTGCDVTYLLAFPDGTPRRASVSLTFRQVIQDPVDQVIVNAGFDQNSPFILEGSIWDTAEDPPPAPGGARLVI